MADRQPFCEAPPRPCVFPACDCDCDCMIPVLEGAGQHSPGCRCVKRQGVPIAVAIATAVRENDQDTLRRINEAL